MDAKLIKGDYIAAHAYTWTEFDIDRNTQQLTVTTYGITPYTQAEMEANPALIAGQKPSIVSQFTLNPKA